MSACSLAIYAATRTSPCRRHAVSSCPRYDDMTKRNVHVGGCKAADSMLCSPAWAGECGRWRTQPASGFAWTVFSLSFHGWPRCPATASSVEIVSLKWLDMHGSACSLRYLQAPLVPILPGKERPLFFVAQIVHLLWKWHHLRDFPTPLYVRICLPLPYLQPFSSHSVFKLGHICDPVEARVSPRAFLVMIESINVLVLRVCFSDASSFCQS